MPHPDYPVLIEPLAAEDGGGYLAIIPDLPGCMSDGETRELAARNVADAIGFPIMFASFESRHAVHR